MNRISKLRSRLLMRQPFFGTLLMTSPLVETHDVPTAATDMRKIYYNPDFFAPLNDEQVIYVLAHEVLHIAFKHGLRAQGRDRKLWNVATDYAINWILHEQGFEFVPGGLLDPAHANKSAEAIYDELLREQEKSPDGASQPGDGDPMAGDVLPADMSSAEQEALDREVTQRVAQAANMARMAGKMSGALERAVSEVLDPPVPIEDLLREFMTQTERDEESWSRRNRRFHDVYLPALHNDSMGEVVMIGDTSGSVSQRDLSLIAGMVTRIAENMRPERVRMVWADTEVAGEQVFERGDALDFQPVGYGGTDMRVPLEHVTQYSPVVTVLVTDGYTPWPDVPPEYPLIVCCTTDTSVPIGQVVRV